MALILERHLTGWNDIYETVEDVRNAPGVQSFPEFLENSDITLLQLSRFLKIPAVQLKKLKKQEGYLSGDAARNIDDYLRIRHNASERAFYESCQHGKLERKQAVA